MKARLLDPRGPRDPGETGTLEKPKQEEPQVQTCGLGIPCSMSGE